MEWSFEWSGGVDATEGAIPTEFELKSNYYEIFVSPLLILKTINAVTVIPAIALLTCGTRARDSQTKVNKISKNEEGISFLRPKLTTKTVFTLFTPPPRVVEG